MGTPVVVVSSGGLPVTTAPNGYGMPIEVAANGYGIPITYVTSGGLPVSQGGGIIPANDNFIDDNGITSFVDDNGVTSFTDDLGN